VVKLVARDGAWSILMWRRQVPLKKISGGITRADKEAILGQNFARMLGMDLAQAVADAAPIPGRP